jgi:hypothetical protein
MPTRLDRPARRSRRDRAPPPQVLVGSYDGSRDPEGTGLPHGRGRLQLVSGDVLDGTWRRGRLSGSADIALADGYCYSGTVADSRLTGSGVSGRPPSCGVATARLPAAAAASAPAARAQVYTADGSCYEGELLEGQRHGYGRLSFAASPLVYEGHWRQGRRHGQGTLYYDAERASCYQGGGAGRAAGSC